MKQARRKMAGKVSVQEEIYAYSVYKTGAGRHKICR